TRLSAGWLPISASRSADSLAARSAAHWCAAPWAGCCDAERGEIESRCVRDRRCAPSPACEGWGRRRESSCPSGASVPHRIASLGCDASGRGEASSRPDHIMISTSSPEKTGVFRAPSLRAPIDILFLIACVALTADVLVPEIWGHGKTKDYGLWYWAG